MNDNQLNQPPIITYAQIILDADSRLIGLAFPILIPGYDKPITDPAAWRQFLRDYRQLEAAAEASERNPDPFLDYGCDCVLPEQVCGGCRAEIADSIKEDFERWEKTGELPF